MSVCLHIFGGAPTEIRYLGRHPFAAPFVDLWHFFLFFTGSNFTFYLAEQSEASQRGSKRMGVKQRNQLVYNIYTYVYMCLIFQVLFYYCRQVFYKIFTHWWTVFVNGTQMDIDDVESGRRWRWRSTGRRRKRRLTPEKEENKKDDVQAMEVDTTGYSYKKNKNITY